MIEHECHACNSCGSNSYANDGLRGFRLGFSAFMVFVLPLMLAVIGAVLARIYAESVVLTIISAFASWVVGVIVARFVTRKIKD